MKFDIVAVALLVGCTGPSSKDEESAETGEPAEPDGQVMRDCEPEVGRICPYAGQGSNGWNGDDVHRLDVYFSFPMSVAFPPPGVAGDPIVADWNNHKFRRILPDPEAGLETIMGVNGPGDGDPQALDKTAEGADGTTVALNHPTMAQYLSDGTLLADTWHTHKFRTWDPADGHVRVVLGSRPGLNAVDSDSDPATPPVVVEQGIEASTVLMNQPKELLVDPNDENLVYYIDMRNERIRLWHRDTGIVDTIGGETVESTDLDTVIGSKGYCGEGLALEVCFNFPKNANPEPGGAIALSADSGTLYVADSESHVIRSIDLATGTSTLLSGTPPEYALDADDKIVTTPHSGFRDGPAAEALWNYPTDFAIDHETNELFVADANNHRIRKIDLDTMEVSTIAGTGTPPCEVSNLLNPVICDAQQDAGDGGLATDASLYRPFGVDIDPSTGDLVISDTYDHRLRVVTR